MSPRPGDRLIIDCGPVGPDYQPGHSHCDTLSFELSLQSRRVVVDSGCCQYEDGEIRKYNRGNAGHNTVTIDGENQSEVWGPHRCGRRAYPLDARLSEQEDGSLHFEGAHDGYRRLQGRPIHHRSVTWTGDRIDIQDRIEGQGVHDIESRLHIHPDLKVEFAGEDVIVCNKSQVLMSASTENPGRIEIGEGYYCPEFNLKHTCPVLKIKLDPAPLPVCMRWILRIGAE